MAHRVAQDDRGSISTVPWLDGIGADVGSQLRIGAGQDLLLGSEFSGATIYVVSEGICLCEWQPNPERRRILELYCPNDIIQPQALPHLPALKLVSVTESQVVSLKLATVESEVLAGRSLMATLFGEFGKAARRKTNLIGSLGGLCAEARVATLFVELSLRLASRQGDQSGFQMPLSRRDIADHLALNADTLSRIITRFKADGLFHQVGRDKIYIKDWQALLEHCPISTALLAEY